MFYFNITENKHGTKRI